MFKDVEMLCEIIFCISGIEKRIALTLKICLLHVLKDNFDEVDEAMFQGFERPCDGFSASRESKK
jgi:hypothetical protein